MAFSPQSDKLAVAQSDNVVYVYKIGLEWGEKKSICNKFQHNSSISCLTWPVKKPNELIYGLAEGVVKRGNLKNHKGESIYQTESYVTAIACASTGLGFVSAHLDGSIYIFSFESPDRGAHMIARHSCVPFALAWGQSIVVAGNNGQILFYGEDGSEEQSFDLSDNPDCREFTVAVSNPTGDGVILGNYNTLHIYTRNKDTMSWEAQGITHVENMYSVTAMDWKPEGDRIAVGTLCGIVDLYDICVKRTMYKGGFELTYVSHSQVIVRHVESNMRIVVRSQYGREILKTNIYKNRFVVGHTVDTILLGDLESLKLSEIQWQGKGNGEEKFIFDNPAACIIHLAGEVSIVEYGIDDILGSIRTSYTSSHVLSLRINERPPLASDQQQQDSNNNHAYGGSGSHQHLDNKKVAFLLDAQTICIKDLTSHSSVTVSHDSKVDWLELNGRANLLLFRDKRRYLHLYNISNQSRSQLLNFCTYVQWVPNSDVVVAQNRTNLCVWYNINAPDQMTIQTIKGDIEEIERSEGKTEVIVDEGISQAVYPLDESLIDFGTAIDDQDYIRAMDILDNLQLTPDVEAMWIQLRNMALNAGELKIAQRCAAAIGDVAMRKFLSDVRDVSKQAEEDLGLRGQDFYKVRCRMSLLNKDLKGAENELLNQGKVDECIDMYQKLFKHEDAIRVAEQSRHPDTIEMRQVYFQHLLDTNQEEKAAALKVRELDYMKAIDLYMKGGMPGKAAQVITDHDIQQPLHLLDSVATALTRAGMHDKAGEFYERLNELQRALDSYVRGNAFRKAVDLSRKCFPSKVVDLQEQWGDYLVSQKQIDMAINHYIEAKNYVKAIEAALSARQYQRALQLVDAIDQDTARPYYKQLARYYESSRQYDLADRCFVSAGQPQLAVEMHTKLGHWEVAHKIAQSYMKEGEVGLLYINQAQKLEAKGRLKEAEKLYLAVKEKDLAINMYKKNRRFDDMVRLVQEHRPDLLKETHQFLAQTLEMEGSLREAEHHYVEAQEWHSAVNMYRSNELWDDAIRVAKFYGGINACKRVTIALLMAIGVVEGAKYLTKHGLVEAAIEHATENGAFDMAVELAIQNMSKKLPEIYLKHALFLEDDERYQEAEQEFIKANKPKEAIEMYVHQGDWESARRVAEQYEPASVADVYIAEAKNRTEAGDYRRAEELFISYAMKPELALSMYQENDRWNDALRVAQLHLPHRVAEINGGYQNAQARAGKGNSRNDFLTVGRSLEQNKQWTQAIDSYLNAKIGSLNDTNDLEDIWRRAIEIARSHVPNRHVQVAVEVSNRLVNLKREESAAEVLFEVGRSDEAITILIEGEKFDEAKRLAKGNNSLTRRVEDAMRNYYRRNNDIDNLDNEVDKLDNLRSRKEWDRLWQVADKLKVSPAKLAEYVLDRVEELLLGNNNTQIDEAVKLLSNRPGPSTDKAVGVYRKLVTRVLSRSLSEETAEHFVVVSMLREFLFKLANQNRAQTMDKKLQAEVLEMLMAVHYQNMFYKFNSLYIESNSKQHNLKELAAKCAVTLLKYPELIPQDKAFYQAGTAAKEVKCTNLAFLLLNRYVDLTEAIASGDASYLDSTELHEADALPLSNILPTKQYLTHEEDREEVRSWVLQVVTDSNVEQELPKREATRGTLYEALFHSDRDTCIVTGYPIYPADMLEVNNSTANRKDWNVYVSNTKTCPWTGQAQNPLY